MSLAVLRFTTGRNLGKLKDLWGLHSFIEETLVKEITKLERDYQEAVVSFVGDEDDREELEEGRELELQWLNRLVAYNFRSAFFISVWSAFEYFVEHLAQHFIDKIPELKNAEEKGSTMMNRIKLLEKSGVAVPSREKICTYMYIRNALVHSEGVLKRERERVQVEKLAEQTAILVSRNGHVLIGPESNRRFFETVHNFGCELGAAAIRRYEKL